MRTQPSSITGSHCFLLLMASGMAYLAIAMGGIVCVTGSTFGCPDWPLCYGKLIPPLRLESIIEYSHRLTALLTSPFIIAAAVVGLLRARSIRWVSRPPALAVPCLLAVAAFGALVVVRGLSAGWAAVDLGLALMVLALMLTASVVALRLRRQPSLPDRLCLDGAFARLSLATLVAVFAVLVSAVLVSEGDSLVRCLGWPLHAELLGSSASQDGPSIARHAVAGVAGLLIVAVVVQAWRTQRKRTAVLRAATSTGVIFAAEAGVGWLIVSHDYPISLLVVHVVLAAALWASLVVLATLAGMLAADEAAGCGRG